MKSWFWPALCALAGLALLALAWSMPAHLRAVNVAVLRAAGVDTPSLEDNGLQLLQLNSPDAARMFQDAAQRADFSVPKLEIALLGYQPPQGRDARLGASLMPAPTKVSAAETIIGTEKRVSALQALERSRSVSTRELLQTRALKETALIPASSSDSGQPFDAAVILLSLLLEERRVSPAFSNEVFQLAAAANRNGDTLRYEELLVDTLSLAQRLTWDQLQVFFSILPGVENLRLLAASARSAESNFPVIYASARMSRNPDELAKYLIAYPETGLHDLRRALPLGQGAVRELLRRQQRLYTAGGALARPFAAFAWVMPRAALFLKWFLFGVAGFLLAAALHYVLPSPARDPLRGFHWARELLFACGFLCVILLVNEPYLAQTNQAGNFPLKIRMPAAGAPGLAQKAAQPKLFMDKSLLTLLFFFVLQSLLYVACLVKLTEVKRQNLAPTLKLKLLDNEDLLFDAGLYVGFVGTIICLILVSLGIVQQSLMAAYSSTSFGIIFVVVFKVFNLRPYKRRLLLQNEGLMPEPVGTAVTRPSV